MNVYIKSRWQQHPDGLGYFWQPANDLPTIIKDIEKCNELISDHFCIMTLWAEYGTCLIKNYYLHVSGITSGRFDLYNRQIKHTILWVGKKDEEKQLRNIMIKLVSGELENKLRQMILPDIDKGFHYEDKDIKDIGLNDNDTLETNSYDGKSIPFDDRNEFIKHLRTYHLPDKKAVMKYYKNKPVLLVSMGEGLSLQRLLKNHKHLIWAYDSKKYERVRNEIYS